LRGWFCQGTVNEITVFAGWRDDQTRISGVIVKAAMIAQDVAIKQGITGLFADKVAIDEAGYPVGTQ